MKSSVIFLGADHAGFELKEKLKPWLEAQKFTVVDLSPKFVEGDDYPKHAFAVAKHVAKTKDARGVLVCGTGVGVSIAANRIKGARAFDAFDERTTKFAREENNVNVIALSGWHQTPEQALKLLQIFFTTKFSSAARHARRVLQLK